ncbi:MAG: hypothetical protein KAJ92_06425 [Gammaproteobacteria bacterium]|nr:hypothetical protein [Gammaproteobacteria bacterium]MCK5263303.1 hypothetical protein [Gammaproteobacteria bacterium]
MEKITIKQIILGVFVMLMCSLSIAHDTTHVHPLITAKIAELIQSTDSVDNAYNDIYELNPHPSAVGWVEA